MASSRVGVSTRTCVCLLARSIRCNSGRAKAAVLPVPVWAWPSTSRPPSSSGIVRAWIGVGTV